MPKIVLLDGFLVNPGDLSWEPLLELGDCQIFERTPSHLVIEKSREADIIITNKVQLHEQELKQLPNLKYIGVTATGFNNIDVAYAKQHGIVVSNVPAYSTASTAQHVMALLLEVTNHVGLHNQVVHASEWINSPDFSFWRKPLIELDKLVLGIYGFGAIGQKVAELGHAFGMKVLVYTRDTSKKSNIKVTMVDKESLFKESDVISLHCPLNHETRHLINKTTLSLMKPSAILINTARGGLIDEAALAEALKQNKILAAALDVLDKEPPLPECPLLNMPNCIITPHIAWASLACRQRLLNAVVDNIKGFLAGKPKNVV